MSEKESNIVELRFKLEPFGELDNDQYRFKILIDRLANLIKNNKFKDAAKMIEDNKKLYNKIRLKVVTNDDAYFPCQILLSFYDQIKRILKKNKAILSKPTSNLQSQFDF